MLVQYVLNCTSNYINKLQVLRQIYHYDCYYYHNDYDIEVSAKLFVGFKKIIYIRWISPILFVSFYLRLLKTLSLRCWNRFWESRVHLTSSELGGHCSKPSQNIWKDHRGQSPVILWKGQWNEYRHFEIWQESKDFK